MGRRRARHDQNGCVRRTLGQCFHDVHGAPKVAEPERVVSEDRDTQDVPSLKGAGSARPRTTSEERAFDM